MKVRFNACQTCGFPKEVERKPVFLKNNVFSLINYQDNVCEECGHQKDGYTLPVVYELLQDLVSKKNKEVKELCSRLKEEFWKEVVRNAIPNQGDVLEIFEEVVDSVFADVGGDVGE